MDKEILKKRFLNRQLIAAVIMTVAVLSVVFLSMRGTAQTGPETCTETVSIYMEISGVDGEAEIGDLTGQIEVERFSHGVYQSQASIARERTSEHQPVTIVKRVDKATPKLYEFSLKTRLLETVTLRFYRGCPDSDPVLYFIIELEGVTIVSVRSYHAGAQEPLPLEEVTFNYTRIKWTWTSMKGNVEAEAEVID